MSMAKSFYVGYYFVCEKEGREHINHDSIFPDERFVRVFDEGGCKEINDRHIYIPNRSCDNCYHLDKYSDTGLINLPHTFAFPPELIEESGKVLADHYDRAVLRYGVVIYVI